MRALVLTADRRLELAERDRPQPKAPRDVLVRVVQTGICGTDRSVLVGKFAAEPGVIMGHEAVGEVAEIGPDVTDLAIGDRVIVNPTLYCGRCIRCLRGQTNFCHRKTGNEIGIDRDGSYAEYILLEDRFLHRIPDGVSYDRAVLTEPLACVLNNLDSAGLTPGEPVTVIGAGPIGLVCAVAARHLGSPVTLIERDDFRRDQARELMKEFFPSDVTVVGADPADRPDRAPTVVDTVGNQLDTALDLADDVGTVVAMGYDSRAEATVRPLEILQRQLRIVGAGDYRGPHFPRAVEMAARLPLERLVTHRFPLERHEEAFAALAASNGSGYSALKVVLQSAEDAQ
ncbi:zinc-dependent alcohol dehydrogenase [Actinomadura keratinilytica]|jgi:threonine dehydrogenase-like Zn-dependent dehydrogenase|uniref:Alcohol dehydrogenase catalytic domain-containing protein n=1 Tax=Actinomadura keratinilytica TaxID=547461 RepID=A0ABP7YKE0_9ACTN